MVYLKAPGVDDMPGVFYKRFWNMVNDDVVHEVLHVLGDDSIPKGWNKTIAVLSMKVRNPDRIKRFSPY